MIQTPAKEPGKRKALALTLLVHLALVVALFLGVQWKRSETEMMNVELWSPVPVTPTRVEPTPPKPPVPEVKKPEPPPPTVEPPKKPEIVVKEEKKKPEPKPPEPKKVEPPPPRVDPLREMAERESLERQATAEQNMRAAQAEQAQRAAVTAAGLARYVAKIRGKVKGNIPSLPALVGNPEAVFEVTQLPTGEVLMVRLKTSSGNAALDAAIERGILKSSPLPKPDDPALFQRVLEIKYRPFDE
jgi:colicin import membrane protein